MPSFDARLRFPGQTRLPINVLVDIADQQIRFLSGDQSLGEWSLEGLQVEPKSDGFHLTLDQEEVILSVTEADRFAGVLGISRAAPAPAKHGNGAGGDHFGRRGLSNWLRDVDPEDQFDDVKRRIEILAIALTDNAVSPADLFGRWLRLLKEVNRRHGQGAMPTPLFYRLNTELLDLIPIPPTAPPPQVAETE